MGRRHVENVQPSRMPVVPEHGPSAAAVVPVIEQTMFLVPMAAAPTTLHNVSEMAPAQVPQRTGRAAAKRRPNLELRTLNSSEVDTYRETVPIRGRWLLASHTGMRNGCLDGAQCAMGGL